MRRHRVVMVVAGAAAVWCAAQLAATAAPTAGAVARAGTWRTAIEVPGVGSLNTGGKASVTSVSCRSAGNCTAGGFYLDRSFHARAFVVSETKGTWAKAIKVPGLGTLPAGGGDDVKSVSCATALNCAAIGTYAGSTGVQDFVVSKKNGTWRNAIEVPGFGALNKHGALGNGSVSCASPGNCTAAGGYQDGSFRYQVFVVSETNGTWRKAIEVPGLGTLNAGGGADVESVSCATAGNCAAIGTYADGTWGNAIEVPGLATLNAGGDAVIFSVSCASAGNCAAGGFYTDGAGQTQAFVVSQVNGTWRNAIEVPGLRWLNTGGDAAVDSVSCASAGNCVAGGGYHTDAYHSQAFVVRETNGTWRRAFKVHGSGSLNLGGLANADSVSCTSAGNCAAGGDYTDGAGQAQTFVASETAGTWRTAIEVPGSRTLPAGRFGSDALVSCATAGNCAAGLTYTDAIGTQQAFVVSQVNGTWRNAIEIPGLRTLNAGGDASITSVSCSSMGTCAAGGSYTDGAGHTQAFVVSQA